MPTPQHQQQSCGGAGHHTGATATTAAAAAAATSICSAGAGMTDEDAAAAAAAAGGRTTAGSGGGPTAGGTAPGSATAPGVRAPPQQTQQQIQQQQPPSRISLSLPSKKKKKRRVTKKRKISAVTGGGGVGPGGKLGSSGPGSGPGPGSAGSVGSSDSGGSGLESSEDDGESSDGDNNNVPPVAAPPAAAAQPAAPAPLVSDSAGGGAGAGGDGGGTDSAGGGAAAGEAAGGAARTSTAQNKNQAKEIARDTVGIRGEHEVAETQCFSGLNPHEAVMVGEGKVIRVASDPEVAVVAAASAGGGGYHGQGQGHAHGGGGQGQGHGGQQMQQQQHNVTQQQLMQKHAEGVIHSRQVQAQAQQQAQVQQQAQQQAQEVQIQAQAQQAHQAQQAAQHGGGGGGGGGAAAGGGATGGMAADDNDNNGSGGGDGDPYDQQHPTQQQHAQAQQQQQQQQPQPQQPDGWRVKLYRLNPDGTWDDCGTGRIVCLIHGRHDGPPYKKRRLSSGGAASAASGASGGSSGSSLPSLAEDKVVVEGSGSSSSSSSGSSSKEEGKGEAAAGTGTGAASSDASSSSSGSGSSTASPTSAAAAAAATAASEPPTTIEALYGHLGEPTLLMRAELPPPPSSLQQGKSSHGSSHGHGHGSDNVGGGGGGDGSGGAADAAASPPGAESASTVAADHPHHHYGGDDNHHSPHHGHQHQHHQHSPNDHHHHHHTINDAVGDDGEAKVLLRTRVLLRGDAYQRQGDNIITWCEPCFAGDEAGSESAASESDAESAGDTSDNDNEGDGGGPSFGGGGGGGAAGSGTGSADANSRGRVSPAPMMGDREDRGQAAGGDNVAWQHQQQQQQSSPDGKQSPPPSDDEDKGGGGAATAAAAAAASATDQDDEPPPGVDLALSFQDNAGCLDIWSKITNVQSRALEILHHSAGSRPGARTLLDPAVHDHHGRSRHGGGHHHHHASSHHPHGHSHQQPGVQQSSLVGGIQGRESGDQGGGGGGKNHHPGGGNAPDLMDDGEGEAQTEDVVSKLAAAAAVARAEPGDIILARDRGHEGGNGGPEPPSSGPLSLHGSAAMEHASALASMAEMGDDVGGVSLPLPTPENLPNITTTLSTVPLPSQRESYALFMSQNECAYLRSLLSLFAPAEQRGDYPTLATLAACVKTVLLLNDAAIIEPIIESGPLFEDICATLEYDPDLRTKARHRHFLRSCTKFRTVIQMDEREGGPDRELIEAIFRSFRVGYLRDTILRPTMDESSLSTLSSLGSFVNTDVVRGVMVPPVQQGDTPRQPGGGGQGSYLSRVLQVLATEILEVRKMEHKEAKENGGKPFPVAQQPLTPPSMTAAGPWSQHLSPQDSSLSSRRIRRSDCLRFLKELFSMVRENLQQSDRDDFFESMCLMEVPLNLDPQQGQSEDESKTIKLLSLLGCILSDPNATTADKSAVLEITSSIAVHDPCLVRRHCLDELKKDHPPRPSPDDKSTVTLVPRKPDLLLSLLCALAVETDVGLLLQVSEVMRIILDTDMAHTDMVGGEIGGFGPQSAAGGNDYGALMDVDVGPGGSQGTDMVDFAPSSSHGAMVGMTLDESSNNAPQGSVESAIKEENRFLSLFYEFYVAWLVAPFQYSILLPSVAPLLTDNAQESTKAEQDVALNTVPPCAVRSSFAIEILSFCVRAHVYRMKFYVLRSRVLGTILGLLGGPSSGGKSRQSFHSANRCLKLSALRFLRAVLSVRDEFYNRHIVQQDLFKPVFDAFRDNPVGDNLVSSAVIEMCNFIRTENIRSLVEYIATKHLGSGDGATMKNGENASHQRRLSLEDVAAPHVDTLAQLRQKYEENLLTVGSGGGRGQDNEMDENQPPRSGYFGNDAIDTSSSGQVGARVAMSERAREDQRKFREVEAEEAFFADGGDDDVPSTPPRVSTEMRASGVASPPPPSSGTGTLPSALQQLQELESNRAADVEMSDGDGSSSNVGSMPPNNNQR